MKAILIYVSSKRLNFATFSKDLLALSKL